MTNATINPTDRQLQVLADAVMRGVVATGIDLSSNARINAAIKVMRAEVMAFLTGDGYQAERECVLAGTVSDKWIVIAIVASCVDRIKAVPAA